LRASSLALAAVIALIAAGCGGNSLSKHDLHKEIGSVQSFAAEGSTLAQGAAESRSTTIFVRVHSEYLEKGAKKVQKKLDQAQVAPDLESKRADAAKLAADVDKAIAELHGSPDDRDLAHRLQLELSKAADDAERLAK
jgi:hypothetical protein